MNDEIGNYELFYAKDVACVIYLNHDGTYRARVGIDSSHPCAQKRYFKEKNTEFFLVRLKFSSDILQNKIWFSIDKNDWLEKSKAAALAFNAGEILHNFTSDV